MIALYILLGLLLLLLLPVGVRMRFAGEVRLTVCYAGIPVYVYSSEKAKMKPKKEKAPKEKRPKSSSKPDVGDKHPSAIKKITAQLKEDGIPGILSFAGEVIQMANGTFRRVFRALRFGTCTVQLAVASGEAGDTALRYGRLCGPVYTMRTSLLTHLRIRRLDVDMRPDFVREEDAVWADIRLHTYPLSVIWVALCLLFSGLRLFMRTSKKKSEDEQNG